MTRPTRARIDLQALQHNFTRVREAAPASRIMAIIKANAYGHGLVAVARALPHADAFGVAALEEGIALREAGFDRRIVLLEGLFDADEIHLITGYRLDCVVHHPLQVELLEHSRLRRPLDVWLKVDSGMHRLGFEPGCVSAIHERLRRIDAVATIRLMSHFACADDPRDAYTPRQIEIFRQAIAGLEGERSLANSAAVLGRPDSHQEWVRPGIMLYGGSPLTGRSAADLALLPVMTLESALIAVNMHPQGAAVGYGGEWVCPEAMPVGVAAIGYGDGYPRHAPGGTPVLVNGRRASLIGRVSMDMICIDLRACPAARVGDPVILWGEGLPVDEIAGQAGTIAYELLCRVGTRVGLDYLG
jgi:alanine racemase